MSNIVISPSATGTGSVTLAAPVTNTNRTLTLPDSAGTLALSSDIPSVPSGASTAEAQAGTDNTTFITPLRMRDGFNASGSAPVYACRAWATFSGTTISASGNVSSITNSSTGVYTVSLTTAMPNSNYAITAQGEAHASGWTCIVSKQSGSSKTTSSFVLFAEDQGGAARNLPEVFVAVHG